MLVIHSYFYFVHYMKYHITVYQIYLSHKPLLRQLCTTDIEPGPFPYEHKQRRCCLQNGCIPMRYAVQYLRTSHSKF